MPGNIVTSYSFRGAGGAIGPRGAATVLGGGAGVGSNLNKVQPLVWWASDTGSNTAVFSPTYGYTVPVAPSVFLGNVDSNILAIRQWYYDHLDGYTFDALPAVLYQSPRSTATIDADTTYWGSEFIRNSMNEADAAMAAVDLTDTTRLTCLIAPMAGPTFGFSSLGQCFGFGPPEGFTIALNPCHPPFVASLWGNRDNSLYGTAFGAPRLDFLQTLESDQARFIAAHELAHAIGYSAAVSSLMPHDTSDFYNLMQSPSQVGRLSAIGNLTSTQKTLMKASPFMAFRSTRP